MLLKIEVTWDSPRIVLCWVSVDYFQKKGKKRDFSQIVAIQYLFLVLHLSEFHYTELNSYESLRPVLNNFLGSVLSHLCSTGHFLSFLKAL